MIRRFLCLVVAVCFGWMAAAQEQAALIADQISVGSDGDLRAAGNVEVFYQGARLRATAIVFDPTEDTIRIEGPLSLANDQGDYVLLADSGEISQDFRDGILTSARLILNRQLQIAGSELRRVDGRYTELFQAVATTCPVCKGSDVPLWQIRASRVIHDQQEQRVYYENALFEVAGLPVFYVPRLRMPDPTVERATGFLIPSIKTSTVLGTGLKLPYYVTLGDHADILFTPYVSTQTLTFAARYRQVFRTGAITLQGALSSDNLVPDKTRGYLFGNGVFFLPRDYELRFDLKASTDESYLFDYGISEQDRLRSDLSLSRTRRASYFLAEATNYRSFRDDEESGKFPALLANVDNRRQYFPNFIGGRAETRLQAYGLARTSTVDVDGRDYARLSAGLNWTRNTIVGPGVRVGATADFSLDHYGITQDSTAEGGTRLTSTGAVDVSWPLSKVSPGGVTQTLEPRLQIVYSDSVASGVPNEESTLVEFDEGALWALDRIPGSSDFELGGRLNAGVSWTRLDPDGWNANVTVGRVIRDADNIQFNDATGLDGLQSDWLLSGQMDFGPQFAVANRLLLTNDASVTRNDLKVQWSPPNFRLNANFLWHIAEPEVGRALDTWELHAGATFPISPNWEGSGDMRYDFITGRTASAGLGLTYKSKCVTVNLGFERSFTSSTSVTPKTDFTIALSVPPLGVASTRPTLRCSQ